MVVPFIRRGLSLGKKIMSSDLVMLSRSAFVILKRICEIDKGRSNKKTPVIKRLASGNLAGAIRMDFSYKNVLKTSFRVRATGYFERNSILLIKTIHGN